jgi:hypothetical protein
VRHAPRRKSAPRAKKKECSPHPSRNPCPTHVTPDVNTLGGPDFLPVGSTIVCNMSACAMRAVQASVAAAAGADRRCQKMSQKNGAAAATWRGRAARVRTSGGGGRAATAEGAAAVETSTVEDKWISGSLERCAAGA